MSHDQISSEVTLLPLSFFDTAPAGLAMEMQMLDAVASGSAPASGFIWQSRTPWLVLPERFGRGPGFEIAAGESAAIDWPVATRKTGGGLTPQGPGVLNVAIAFQTAPGRARTIRDSYATICNPITEAMRSLGVSVTASAVTGSFCDGDYNLAVDGRKIVGTAQRWRGGTCLCHALLLTDIALTPTVAAIQKLSQNLGHDTQFKTEVHCRLADFMSPKANVDERATEALENAITAQGFAPYKPGSPQF